MQLSSVNHPLPYKSFNQIAISTISMSSISSSRIHRYLFLLLLMSAHSIITIVSGWAAQICWRAPFQGRAFQLSNSLPKVTCKMDSNPSFESRNNPPDSNPGFDVLNASVSELQALLNSGTLNSTDLVHGYLDCIGRHNSDGLKLKAIISVAPRASALARAQELDEERASKGSRGPMHGIPVLVKDTFWTHPSLGMDTTCGTIALRGAKPKRNAAVVDMLLNAGMIIIGKANLSELALMKGSPPLTGGWSSAGGQCQSPYVRGGVLPNATFLGHSTPCGSSSGSAAGVAAGFAPISIGHETDGSIVQSATRAGLYAIKIQVGKVALEGSMPVCSAFDSHGGIARTASDLASMTALLMGEEYLSPSLGESWEGIVLGMVDPDLWQPAPFVVEPNEDFKQQTYHAMADAAEKIEASGGKILKGVKLITLTEIAKVDGGADPDDLFGHDFKNSLENFIGDYEESPVRTLQQLVDFHKNHADVCLPPDHPSQGTLEFHLTAVPDPNFEQKLATVREAAQQRISQMLSDNGIDAIIGPADARMASVASVAGYAVGSMPLGYANYNGRAFGMNIIAGENGEGKILEIMSAWEKTFPGARKPPPMLASWAVKREGREGD